MNYNIHNNGSVNYCICGTPLGVQLISGDKILNNSNLKLEIRINENDNPIIISRDVFSRNNLVEFKVNNKLVDTSEFDINEFIKPEEKKEIIIEGEGVRLIFEENLIISRLH